MAGKIGRVFLLDSHLDMFECIPRYEAKYIHRAKSIPAKCTFYKVAVLRVHYMLFQNGTLLLSQLFSMEPVVNIKCRTYEPPRHAADSEKVTRLIPSTSTS